MPPHVPMEIEWLCTKLVWDFAYYMDQRQYEDLAALFTPDGLFDRVGQRLQGRREIVEALSARPLDQRTRHLTVGVHFLSAGPSEATAVVYNASHVGRGDQSDTPSRYAMSQPIVLEFRDTYRRSLIGWRIAERIARMMLVPEDMPSR